jgi:hypothetical protein
MEQRILMRGKQWMLWFWPYHVLHPWWGFRHGLDGKCHSFLFWCLQFWWQGRRPNDQVERTPKAKIGDNE